MAEMEHMTDYEQTTRNKANAGLTLGIIGTSLAGLLGVSALHKGNGGLLDSNIDITDDTPFTYNFDEICDMIRRNFGEEVFHLFWQHANGASYEEIEKSTSITNIKYRFRRIREYIRKYYCVETE